MDGDSELMMGEVLVMDEIFMMDKEAMEYEQGTWNEESMDYEQWIMDEMMGWRRMTPGMNQQPSAFSYNALDQPKYEIRVIHLNPRRWLTDSTITCEITTVDLRTAPLYEALSYEWGPLSKEYTIKLNQTPFSVRQNLWWALYDLRDARESRDIWIDALCINQSDIHERNDQVSRMGDIYSQATRVVAWIGQGNYESRYAYDFLSDLNSISPEIYCPAEGLCQPGQHRGKWQALSRLCRRSYWSRLWIIQEVLLASDLHIQCGPLSFRWEALSNVFFHLQQGSTGLCSPGLKLSLLSSIPFMLETRRKQHSMAILANENQNLIPLFDLVYLFKDALCFDSRDKIFGLRRLSLPCCNDAVKVDYSMEFENIIHNLFAHNDAEHVGNEVSSPKLDMPAFKSNETIDVFLTFLE